MLTTATLERINAATIAFPETPVDHPSGPWNTSPVDVFVTDIWSGTVVSEPHRDTLVGTVRKATSTSEGSGWVIPVPGEDASSYVRAHASRVNPEPVNGRHYRVITPEGGGQLLRYNDTEHSADRNRVLHPWSVVAGAMGAPWPYPNDSIDRPEHYLEVEYETAGQSGTNAPDPEPGIEVVRTITNEVTGPTKGRAHLEADGTVLLNPEPVPGEMYLLWHEGITDPTMTALALHLEGDTFTSIGYFYRSGVGDVEWSAAMSHTLPGVEARSWAKAALASALTGTEEEQAAALRQANITVSTEASKWSDLDEALSSLAREKDWCSEFESVIEPLGFTPRETKSDFEVRVTARVRVEIDSPDSAVDDRIASYYDLPGLSITSMTFEGSVTVAVTVDDTTEEGAREYVDSDAIESAMGSSADVEILDWEVDSVDAC